VDSLIRISFRKQKRLDRLVLLACCLGVVSSGRVEAQYTPAPAASPAQSEIPGTTACDDQGTDRTTQAGVGNVGRCDSLGLPANSPTTPSTVAPGSRGVRDTSFPPGPTSPLSPQLAQDRRQPRISVVPPPSEFQKVIAGSTGQVVPIFGMDLFNSAPSTFAPVDNIPVTPDYVIGPGDEIRLQVWGQVNQRGSFVVDRTGSISLPEVGTIQVAGLQYSQLSDFLKSQLGRVYRNFDLNVNMGQLRSIQVFVVGKATKPGSYTIGSMSTLLNALFASGGPLPQGSLRDIQVKRGRDTVTHFDLYDLLLHGDKTKDVRLESGDVIFIPDVGPQVAVLGSVNTPAVYELRGEQTFGQAVALAGGVTNVADGSRLRVERVYKHTERSALDVDFANNDPTPVQDGDIISVKAILDRFQNAVTLRGNVANPGRFPWHPGMHVSDLIPSRDALITRNYYLRHDLLGQVNSDRGVRQEGALGINSGAVADRAADRGTARPNAGGNGGSNGASNSPGNSANNDASNSASNGASSGGGNAVGATLTENSSIFSATTDVILSAPDIDWEYAVIERQSSTDLTTSLLPFNLEKAVIDKVPSQDLELLSGDVVTIFSKADISVQSSKQTKFVRLEGEFAASGVYSVLPGETLRQLLARAGGFSPDAFLFASEFIRDSVRRVERQRIVEYADALEGEITARSASLASSSVTERDAAAAQESGAQARAALVRLRQVKPTGRIVFQLKPDSKAIEEIPDLALEDGDRFIVPKQPATVSVQGQVYDANAFVFEKGRRLKDYLRLAGGPDRVADRNREFLLRADGSVVSRQYGGVAHRALFADSDFDNIALLPGDTIVVPPAIEKGSILRNITNIATIVEGFGLGAAALNVLK
jgi:polysaccharide biosynthesis/export protein